MDRKLILLLSISVIIFLVSCSPKDSDYGEPAINLNKSEIVFDSNGSEQTIKLLSTVPWVLDGYIPAIRQWVKIFPEHGVASKSPQVITIKVFSNKSIERKADLRFISSDRKLTTDFVILQNPFIPEVVTSTIGNVTKNGGYKYQRYKLEGVISKIRDHKKGIFDFKDATGIMTVNGLSSKEQEYGKEISGEFNSLLVKERDTVIITGYRTILDNKPSIAYAFLVKVLTYREKNADEVETKMFPYSIDFRKGQGAFIINNKKFPLAFDAIWRNSLIEGMAASAYHYPNMYETESWLFSPKIKLSKAKNPVLVFTHIVNFFKSLEVAKKQTSLFIRKEGGEWKKVSMDFSYPDKLSSSLIQSEEINLKQYNDATIQIAFRYMSDAISDAGKWQILSLNVKESEEKVQKDNSGSTEDYNKIDWEWN